jgi:hypothetical protein
VKGDEIGKYLPKEKQKDENRPFLDFSGDSKGCMDISVKLLIIIQDFMFI